MDIQRLLNKGATRLQKSGIPIPSLDAEVLLGFVLKKDRTYLLAHREETVSRKTHKRFERLLKRREQNEPVAYLTGTQEFYSRDFAVTHSVLIPRPKTEVLIEEALNRIPHSSRIHVADIGTGCGNIAITIACERPRVHVYATDISTRALAVARKNAQRHHVKKRISFLHGNLLQPLARMSPDILLANLPYVPAHRKFRTAAERATRHEPAAAQYGTSSNRSGYEVLLRFLHSLRKRKNQPRLIFLEYGPDQHKTLRQAAEELLPNYSWKLVAPLQGTPRVLVGKR